MKSLDRNDQDKRREQLQDRLTEQQLREAFDAETPPDLASPIFAAADRSAESDPTAPTPTRVAAAPASAKSAWRDLAIAACLLVLIGGGVSLVAVANYQARQTSTVAHQTPPVVDAQSANSRFSGGILLGDVYGPDEKLGKKTRTDQIVSLNDAERSATESGIKGIAASRDGRAATNGDDGGQKVFQQYGEASDGIQLLVEPRIVSTESKDAAQVVTSAQKRINVQTANQASPRRDIVVALHESDKRYNEYLKAVEQTNQAMGEVQRNEQRQQQLVDELIRAKTVLDVNDLSIDTPAAGIVPKIDGLIIQVAEASDQLYTEVSVGSDDGLRQGHEVEVYRGGTWLGRGTIVRTTPDRAVAKIDRKSLKGEIKPRDRIETRRSLQTDEGTGPDDPGDQYIRIVENEFLSATDQPLSTFSIDVDTASYANVRQFLLQSGRLPPPDAVRIEELVNYFDYDYAGPEDERPFASHMEVAGCPWQPKHRLLRIALKGKEVDYRERPNSNLVFLIDVSGSMQNSNKLPLCVAGMKLLAGELNENDRVAIVVYANSEGLVLPSTPGAREDEIIAALDRLQAGGSTNGGAGIQLAYQVAQDNFVKGGINRVILCTDGDFNVGTTSTAELERMAEDKATTGVFLTVLGFGRGNLNDAMMETISNKGNGNYAYIDGLTEAKKVLIEQMSGTLMTIAKDVKIQVEFNPAEISAYRLIGYENRVMAAEDFNDDLKDAGEIGAGHTVTALYEIVPHPKKDEKPTAETGDVDALKYQRPAGLSDAAANGELLTLKLRYKQPDGEVSRLLQFPLKDDGIKFGQASEDFKFASSVAAFGMLLRGSKHAGDSTIDAVLEIAQSSKGEDKHGYRAEFVELAREAKRLGK